MGAGRLGICWLGAGLLANCWLANYGRRHYRRRNPVFYFKLQHGDIPASVRYIDADLVPVAITEVQHSVIATANRCRVDPT